MEPDLTFPIFVVAENDRDPYPLIFVAGTLEELGDYFKEHDKLPPLPEDQSDESRVTSRFFDLNGRRWSHEGADSSGSGLVPTEDSVSPQYLRELVASGYTKLTLFDLEDEANDLVNVANFLANEFGSNLPADPPNPGSRRHERWHKAHGIPINAPH